MSEILFRYQRIDITSWAYLSSLLTLAMYFKFNRLLSVRNLDLCGLILLAPGLLLVQHGIDRRAKSESGAVVSHDVGNADQTGSTADEEGDRGTGEADPASEAAFIEHMGYVWLILTQLALLGRLLLDNSMVRRPLLEPNMSVGGITFLAISLFLFLMANVLTGTPSEEDVTAAKEAEHLQTRMAEYKPTDTFEKHGPGYHLIFLIPHIVTKTTLPQDVPAHAEGESPEEARRRIVYQATARAMAILSQLMIVIGMISIGRRHFDNIGTGIATAQLYLLLPYTAVRTGAVTDALPAALIIWAVVTYRRPIISGGLIGLAIGATYFPIFLLPLWIGFYWHRGVGRFVGGLIAALAVVVASLAFTSAGWDDFFQQLRAIFGVRLPPTREDHLAGIWDYWSPVWRLPILVTFLALCFSMSILPAHKNLGTLLSLSAVVMLGTQFWHPTTTGMAMAWYLPLVLLTVFRPNLEDRYALAVVPESRWGRRRSR